MPPDNDEDFTSYSMVGHHVKNSHFSIPSDYDHMRYQTEADQLDLLMNNYHENFPPSYSELQSSIGHRREYQHTRYITPEEVGNF